MAKKVKTFAEKAMGKKSDAPVCPKCGEAYTPILVVNSEKNEEDNQWKFARKIAKLCKCNEKEVFA
ncbi:hypothetical protein AMJ80_01190 [bacterium SM23_31]|nr:MAG: hypothetical protein AMJ80_01190 [bacterium SM23_31]